MGVSRQQTSKHNFDTDPWPPARNRLREVKNIRILSATINLVVQTQEEACHSCVALPSSEANKCVHNIWHSL